MIPKSCLVIFFKNQNSKGSSRLYSLKQYNRDFCKTNFNFSVVVVDDWCCDILIDDGIQLIDSKNDIDDDFGDEVLNRNLKTN